MGCLVGLSACLVAVAGRYKGGRKVGAECGLGPDKSGVEPGEGVGEDGDGVGMTEAGEGVAAPAGEVYGVEGDIGLVVGGIAGQEGGGVVEGVQAGAGVVVCGEGFAVGGGEPGLQDSGGSSSPGWPVRGRAEDHPHTLRSAYILALCLWGLGQHEPGRQLAEDTLARCRRVLGENHPETLRALRALRQHEAARHSSR